MGVGRLFRRVSFTVANRIALAGILGLGAGFWVFLKDEPGWAMGLSLLGSACLMFFFLHVILDVEDTTLDLKSLGEPAVQKSWLSTAQRYLNASQHEVLSHQRGAELRNLLLALDTIQERGMLDLVLNKAAKPFEEASEKIRLRTAKMFRQLTSVLSVTRSASLHERFSRIFLASLEKETAKPVYRELADLLEQMVKWSLANEQNRMVAVEVVNEFRRHELEEISAFPSRRRLAFKALKRMSDQEAIKNLIGLLQAEDPSTQREAVLLAKGLIGKWLRRAPRQVLEQYLNGRQEPWSQTLLRDLENIP